MNGIPLAIIPQSANDWELSRRFPKSGDHLMIGHNAWPEASVAHARC